ncbi:MAG: hypothetical protein WC055_12295 [Melioribacteraceae bacterium]
MHESNKKKYSIVKFIPYFGLVALTIALMFFFKSNKYRVDNFIEDNKDGLTSFYTANLKPLFVSNELSKEDVFNFAYYQNLPIDKENNRVLFIKDDPNTGEVFEVKSAKIKENTDNYQKFKEHFNLDTQQLAIADSILDSYKDEIYSAVWTNEQNTIAVSPRLPDLRRLIFADLMEHIQKITGDKKLKTPIDVVGLAKLEKSFYENRSNDFIFIASDTVFKSAVGLDRNQLKNQIALSYKKNGFEFNFPVVPVPPPPPQSQGMNKNSSKEDASITKYVFDGDQIKVYSHDPGRIKIEVPSNVKEMGNIKLEFNIKELNEDLNRTLKETAKNNDPKKWEEFGLKWDSIGNMYSKMVKDSMKRKYKMKLEKESNLNSKK